MPASRVKIVRETLHLSQREFGEKLGVSRDVISNIEYERVQPKKLFLQHMCQTFKVNEHWLETGEGELFYEDCSVQEHCDEILSIFKSLSPAFRACALEQIRQLAELQNKER